MCLASSPRPGAKGNANSPTVNHTVFDHTSVLKMIESVFDVQPLAGRETSNDVGNLLSVLTLDSPQPTLPTLPQPGYVIPSTFCFSSLNPAVVPAGVPTADVAVAGPVPVREDEEATIFLKMITTGMVKGFPGN